MSSDSSNDSFENTEKTAIVTSDTFNGKIRAADETPASLVVLVGPQGYVGKQFFINQPEMIMGRSVDSQIFIDERSFSRQHARFQIVNNEVMVLDLGSSNKTMVNNEVLQPMVPHTLKNNDRIQAGNIILKFYERGSLEAHTNQELNEKAQKDALTGAYSKRALLEKGPEAIKRADMLGEPMTILVCDIDFFKKINDNNGHPGGDHVLKHMSLVIQTKMIRQNDFFARYGGEEFVVILSAANIKTATEVAERMRKTIETTEFSFEGKAIPVTISIGLAERKPTEMIWDDVFKRADDALYQSKQNGRNRVTIAP